MAVLAPLPVLLVAAASTSRALPPRCGKRGLNLFFLRRAMCRGADSCAMGLLQVPNSCSKGEETRSLTAD
eukprot:1529396-Pyramimonas_sp.AAC.1